MSLGIHLFSSVLARSSNNKSRKSLALVATAGQSNTFVLVSCPTRLSYISTSQEQRNMARDVLHLYCLVVISSPNKSSKSLTLVAKPYICTDLFHFPFISILQFPPNTSLWRGDITARRGQERVGCLDKCHSQNFIFKPL